jgi:uncharacterized Fe-S cluster protein YjdI
MSRRLQVAVHCAIDARNTTGESPLWAAREGALYWVDIPEGVIRCWHPETGAIGEREVFVQMQPEWGRPDRTPQAGGVFVLEPGVAGAPAAFYQG